jgi:hypothetical protein
VRKTASYRGTRGDGREGNKRDKGYKRANGLEVSLREGLVEFIYEFSYLDPIEQLAIL